MTIWVFGDSYMDNYDTLTQYKQISENGTIPWTKQFETKLNQKVHNLGRCGSSPDYSYTKFNENRHLIKSKDVVIFGLTSLDRRWFKRERPYMTVVHSEIVLNMFDKNERDAVKKYLLYLEHPELYETYLLDFLYNLHSLTRELDLHTIIIPCMFSEMELLETLMKRFPRFHFVEGCLAEVTRKQYTDEFCGKWKNMVFDGMVNHLIWSNHTVLYEKIKNNIINDDPINFFTGFLENVISQENIDDQTFFLNEFSAPIEYL